MGLNDFLLLSLDGQVFSYFYAISGLLAIIATMILNAIVIHHLWRMRRSRLIASPFRPPEEISTKNGGSGLGSEMRMVIFLMAIIVVFTVCYAPLMVSAISFSLWLFAVIFFFITEKTFVLPQVVHVFCFSYVFTSSHQKERSS